MELKTPLYDVHVKYGGKIVPFGGYLLPVQYGTGIVAEHMAVRTKAGLFDVSHMGEVTFEGKDALKNINMLVTNDCSGMYDGQVRYSPMCNENGGVVDDLLVYKKNDESYLVVINAANHDKDVAWMKARVFGDAVFTDISSSVAQLALQGPASKDIILKLTDEASLPVKYYSFTEHVGVGGIDCLVSRTGYTGEFGYELYTKPENAADLWEKLIEAGAEFGLIPCGLGARDTLRLEAAMPLYGHEMNDEITPLETGLGYFVKMTKDDFIGKAAMENKGEPTIKRIGVELCERGIAREECKVFSSDKEVGHITSGTMCPYLKKAVGMALVDKDISEGDELFVEVRGKKLRAEAVALPFYKRTK
ncbi:MAG: glycine cleavage system aminomethyltransferase GcvT [Clostridiales bacterium]|nr:glycine cleavage system aminomethyltransferase GcvT [Clostridiales bacterium]